MLSIIVYCCIPTLNGNVYTVSLCSRNSVARYRRSPCMQSPLRYVAQLDRISVISVQLHHRPISPHGFNCMRQAQSKMTTLDYIAIGLYMWRTDTFLVFDIAGYNAGTTDATGDVEMARCMHAIEYQLDKWNPKPWHRRHSSLNASTISFHR